MSKIATRPAADVIATIECLHRDLEKVRAVEAILGAAATQKVFAIEAEIAAANVELSEALAAEHAEARAKLLASFTDIDVAVSYPPFQEGKLLSAGFTITYERLCYNMAAKENMPTRFSCNGFAALPDEVFAYLLEVKPEAIPAEIMALAPGNAREAFSRFFSAKQRGYVAA